MRTMRKRILAILLAVFMIFPLQVFALEGEPADNASVGTEVTQEETSGQSDEAQSGDSDITGDLDVPDDESGDDQVDETDPADVAEEPAGTGKTLLAEGDPAGSENGTDADGETGDTQEEEIDYSVWTSEDFTYTEYSQRLYGCDYSRDFTVSGTAIAGFSETGLKKLEKNTDLVLPSVSDTGEDLCGVAPQAFSGKGLTSVKFPTGMYVDYDDKLTNTITKRGNFVIAENAFSKNELTNLKLPDGVIAVMSYAFQGNKLTTVTLPKTIWWTETMAFANNEISKVNFPERTWFQFEMHGMTFGDNNIKSVRLPDNTAVVNMNIFMLNPGMEALPAEASAHMNENAFENSGVVYMYTDNPGLTSLDRIHHIDKTTSSTKSWFQKLVVIDGSEETQNPDTESWNKNDFTYDGQTVTGLSESGIAKRATNKNLVIPDYTPDGQEVTAIADSDNSIGGLFATEEEKFDSVTLPSELKVIGNNAFRESGLSEVDLPPQLKEIGMAAFSMNSLETVVLPDTVEKLGGGAFSSNKNLRKVVLSKSLTEIAPGAFGCSDMKNWMPDFKKVVIPEGITKIGSNAFAGSNLTEINIPEGVTEIGEYAFSTKNYLMYDDVECTLTLPSTLTKIGNRAFRNKLIAKVELPESVTALPKLTFEKMLSTSGTPDIPGSEPQGMVTKVYVSSKAQYEDKTNFPDSEFHKIILTDSKVWTAEDFTYGEDSVGAGLLYINNNSGDALNPTLNVVTGFSDSGKEKFALNQNIVIPSEDTEGNKVQGVGKSAFKGTALESEFGCKLKSVTFPENVKTANDKPSWNADLEERGDFFILNGAFSRNELTSLDLPEGVIYVDSTAFSYNELTSVKFPKTITLIRSQAFANNQIRTLEFPGTVDYCLNIENMAFAINKIVSVQLPDNTGTIGSPRPAATLATVFFQNTGNEPVTGGNENLQKGGIVYMYKKTASNTDYIYNTENGGSYVQKLIIGTMPSDQAPWGEGDFTFSEDGATITGLTEAGKAKLRKNPDLVLPDKGPDGTTITAIGDGVPGSQGKEQIGTFGFMEDGVPYVPTTVVLPSSLESIGTGAFSSYINNETGEIIGVTSVQFPATLKNIGATAFQNAPITSVELPEGFTTLGNGAFTGTIYLSEILLPSTLETIPAGAFTKTNSKIAFTDMATVDELVIPEGVKSIGNTAFQGSKIKSLTLPEGLETIGNNAFNNHQLTELYIPGSVTSVGRSAFALVNESLSPTLKKLVLGDEFDGAILADAFRGHALTKVEIPNEYSFDKIKAGAFNDTENKVKLLTSNEAEAARYAGLANTAVYSFEVVYDKLAGSGWSEDDFTYSEDGTAITGLSESGAALFETRKDLILPDKSPDGTVITEIADEAFAIPEEQVDIGKYDANSDGFTSVDYPSGLVRIGTRAFEYNMLTEADFSEFSDIKEIGDSAFHGNHIENVYLPDSIDTLGGGAFAMNSITKLRLSKNVTVIPQGVFSMNIRMSTLDIPDTVTEIGEMAFAGARLTTLEIPASVVKIGRKAFHLHHLDTLTVPGNVKEIGESAFEGTFKDQTLTSLTLEEGIETIGPRAFKEGLLTSVELPTSLTALSGNAFENNTGTGEDHKVILTTQNPDHVQFNDGATSFTVIYGDRIVSLNAQGGVSDPGYLELDNNGRILASEFPTPEFDECHEFAGWFTEREGGTEVTRFTRFQPGQIIYAHWDEHHDWDEGALTTAPTKDSDGVMTYTCTRNSEHTKTETVKYDWDASDFTYEGSAVTGLSKSGKMRVTFNHDMVIPDETPDGAAITEIGDSAFEETEVETVKYPAGLKKIGKQAFRLSKLKEALIPDTVTELGQGAYAMTFDVAKISLPEGITSIPAGLFIRQLIKGSDKYDDYPSAGELVIPDGVKSIGNSAFQGLCLTKVTLPDGLETMEQAAFANNKFSKVEIPGSLKSIPKLAFGWGKAMFKEPVLLTELKLNEGTEVIGVDAFENSGLKSVQLPTTIKSIHDSAFRVGIDATPDMQKILLRGTPEQHFDTALNTGTGLGHKFAPLITFDPNGGTLENIYAEVNDEYKLDSMPEPENDGCLKCDGWCREADGTETLAADEVFEKDTTLYAHWVESHDYVRTVVTKPTADEEGLAEYVCSKNPEHSYTEPIPKLTEEEVAARDEALEKASDKIISANGTLASGEYTSETYAALSEAIDAANALYDDPTATEADVKAAEAAIAKATRNLKPVDKSVRAEEQERNNALDKLARNIIDATSTVKASAYKANSYSKFKSAVAAANAVIDDLNSDSGALNSANEALLMAWKNLEKKSAQPMKVKAKTVTVKAKAVKKKAQKIAVKRALTVTKQVGKVTYKKAGGNKKITVASTGKITVKKGLKKGTYKVRIKVTAKGNGTYKAGSKTVTVKVRVK